MSSALAGRFFPQGSPGGVFTISKFPSILLFKIKHFEIVNFLVVTKFSIVHACMLRRFHHVQLSATLWSVAFQAPLPMVYTF